MKTKVKWFRCLACDYVSGFDTEADSRACSTCGGMMIHVSEEDPEVQAFLKGEIRGQCSL